jgi:hypothetical protein
VPPRVAQNFLPVLPRASRLGQLRLWQHQSTDQEPHSPEPSSPTSSKYLCAAHSCPIIHALPHSVNRLRDRANRQIGCRRFLISLDLPHLRLHTPPRKASSSKGSTRYPSRSTWITMATGLQARSVHYVWRPKTAQSSTHASCTLLRSSSRIRSKPEPTGLHVGFNLGFRPAPLASTWFFIRINLDHHSNQPIIVNQNQQGPTVQAGQNGPNMAKSFNLAEWNRPVESAHTWAKPCQPGSTRLQPKFFSLSFSQTQGYTLSLRRDVRIFYIYRIIVFPIRVYSLPYVV